MSMNYIPALKSVKYSPTLLATTMKSMQYIKTMGCVRSVFQQWEACFNNGKYIATLGRIFLFYFDNT